MYCRYCGKELENDVVVCRYCGIPTYGPYRHAPQKISPEFKNNVNTDMGMGGDYYVPQPEPKRTYLVQGITTPDANNIPPVDNPQRYAPQPAPNKNVSNGFSIAGFVLAIISMVITLAFPLRSLFFSCYAIVPIIGLIFSAVGIKNSKTLGVGKGLAVAGKIINVLLLAFFVAYFVLYI